MSKHQLSIWKEQVNPIVRMHNHLVTANFGQLELNSMRIFLLMLAKLDRDASDFSPIKINLQDIDPNCFGGKNFELIMKAMDELKAKMKDVRMIWEEDGSKIYKRMTVIDSIEYKQGTDYIIADFGRAVRPYLLQLKGNFTQAELKELLKLKSSYAIRFYMLVKSLFREGQVYTTSVKDFRMMLVGNLDQYPDYRDFKKRVLQSACKALEKTSSAFVFEEEKTGRNITSIIIKPKIYPAQHNSTSHISKSLKAVLDDLNVNTYKIEDLLAQGKISDEYIKYVIEVKQKDKKIKKLGAAIYDAVINGYLIDDFEKSKERSITALVKPDSIEYKVISLKEAQIMYEQDKASGKTKFPFAGYVRGLKIGRNTVVDGYTY